MPSVIVDDKPYQYEAEAEAGIELHSGRRWTGARLKYRPGTRGHWRHVVVYDLHPMDTTAVERALIAWIPRDGHRG